MHKVQPRQIFPEAPGYGSIDSNQRYFSLSSRGVNRKFTMNQVLFASTFFYISNPLRFNFFRKTCHEKKKKPFMYWVTNAGTESDEGWEEWWLARQWADVQERVSQHLTGTSKLTSYTWPAAEHDREEHCGQHFPGCGLRFHPNTPERVHQKAILIKSTTAGKLHYSQLKHVPQSS